MLAALVGQPAAAQTREPFRPRSLEFSVGGAVVAGSDLGTSTAALTRNQPGGGEFVLFRTQSELAPGPGLEARLGYHLTRAFAVEGGFLYSGPTLRTRITGDTEGAPAVTATTPLDRYVFEGSGVYHLLRWRLGGGVPFLIGGAGYVRQLHDERVLVETGQAYHAGGGLKFVFGRRPRGLVRAFGLRVEGRVYVFRGGLDLSEDVQTRATPSASASGILFF